MIKSMGFSDKKLSEITNTKENIVREKRSKLKVMPVFKKWILVLQNSSPSPHICIQPTKEIMMRNLSVSLTLQQKKRL